MWGSNGERSFIDFHVTVDCCERTTNEKPSEQASQWNDTDVFLMYASYWRIAKLCTYLDAWRQPKRECVAVFFCRIWPKLKCVNVHHHHHRHYHNDGRRRRRIRIRKRWIALFFDQMSMTFTPFCWLLLLSLTPASNRIIRLFTLFGVTFITPNRRHPLR